MWGALDIVTRENWQKMGHSPVEGAQEPFRRGAAGWGLGARWMGMQGGSERRPLGQDRGEGLRHRKGQKVHHTGAPGHLP